MNGNYSRPPHGAFALSFEDDYTLITFSGLWNTECTEIYDALLRQRVTSKPELRRCVLIDARKWGLETPDSGRKKKELNRYLSTYYKELFIAYVLSPDNLHLGKYILDTNNGEFRDVMNWQLFPDLTKAVTWLRTKDFELPEPAELEFPSALPAYEYLKYLK